MAKEIVLIAARVALFTAEWALVIWLLRNL